MNTIIRQLTQHQHHYLATSSSRSLLFNNSSNCSLRASAAATAAPAVGLLAGPRADSILVAQPRRTYYIYSLGNKSVRYRRTTRPKKTSDDSIPLSYEHAQFAEHLGVTKSWNTWNSSNLLDGKRQAETVRDDTLIRRFIYGTFIDLFASEIIIKRRFNIVDIGFLVRLPRRDHVSKCYFLVGYSEQLLSALLKCVVRIQIQTIQNKNDLIFRYW